MTSGSGPAPSWVSSEFGIALGAGRSTVGLTMAQLIQLALRRNPKRAQLLVSTVLGKHLPADPRVVAGAGRLLGMLVARVLDGNDEPIPAEVTRAAGATVSGADPAALLDLFTSPSWSRPTSWSRPMTSSVVTLGFAETATSLGHLVADQLGSVYLHSTRHTEGPVPVAAGFAEPHSHATGHLLRPDPPTVLAGTGPVVLVDDELSTGRTALNVIEALHAVAPRELYVLAGLVDLRADTDDLVRAEVAGRLGCRIEVVSLVRGSIAVPPDARERVWAEVGADETAVPVGGVAAAGMWRRLELPWPAGVPTGGRHGFTPADRPAFDRAVDAVAAAIAAEGPEAGRILIVGTEELMYLPLAVALAMARDSKRRMLFQSTTRSPVHAVDRAGYPIRRRIDFISTEHADGALRPVTRHLYNAALPPADGGPLQEADLIVVIDDGQAIDGPDGAAARVAAVSGRPVILAVLPAVPGPPDGVRVAVPAEVTTS